MDTPVRNPESPRENEVIYVNPVLVSPWWQSSQVLRASLCRTSLLNSSGWVTSVTFTVFRSRDLQDLPAEPPVRLFESVEYRKGNGSGNRYSCRPAAVI